MQQAFNLVQLRHPTMGRRIAVVKKDELHLLNRANSIYELAMAAISDGRSLADAIKAARSSDILEYDPIYAGKSDWRLLPAFDHPDEPARCLVTGTGLTHRKSAENRQAMHAATTSVSDSMKMYQRGLEGGRPAAGTIGASPEWFYKGCGSILRAHGEALEVPAFALDGGDEAEVAGAYVIDSSGTPRRVGLMLANEFSDHVLEEKSYLYLAHSKLRTCSIGPELVVNPEFTDLKGTTRISRSENVIWSKPFATGESNMCHSLANLEHHHFKYPAHRRPGDAHVYFFGTDAFSFGDKVRLQDGDVMEMELEGFGRALRNSIRREVTEPKPIIVRPI
jgi:hypothetical protein